jgi:hypothetical protein
LGVSKTSFFATSSTGERSSEQEPLEIAESDGIESGDAMVKMQQIHSKTVSVWGLEPLG